MRLRLAMALLVLATGTAHAGTIRVGFEGILGVVSGIPGADAGTTFSGTYTYEDTAAVQMLSASSARYSFSGAPATGFSLKIHTATPVEFSGSPLNDITVNNASSGDSMAVVATTAGGDFRLDLTGGTNLLSSFALATPDLSQGSGMLQYTNLGAGFIVLMGTLTSLSVPEPSSVLLLGLGAAALAWRRSRRV